MTVDAANKDIRVDVVVEVPRGTFSKRGWNGQVDFISPIPCPFNYGSVPQFIGLEGDLLDAVVLGPRLRRGATVNVTAWAAIGFADRDLYDDKLICSTKPLTPSQRRLVAAFFYFYAICKRGLNAVRGQTGYTAFTGWHDAESAIRRARPRDSAWHGPTIPF